MKHPMHREAPPSFLRRSQRLLRRTRAIPELAGPSSPLEPFSASVADLQARYLEWTSARSDASVAIAALHEAQLSLDQQLRGVGLVILAAGRGRRSYEIYLKYFPYGYGQTLRLGPRESLGVAAGILAAMTDETDPDILARREPLTAARVLLESAMTSAQTVVDALGQAKAHLETTKLAWRKAYTTFYYALRTILFDRRDYVESLFGDPRTRVVDEQPADPAKEPAAAPVPAPVPIHSETAT